VGHIRVGRLPKRHGWDSVIAALEAETKTDKQIMDEAARVAAKSLGVTRYQGSLNLCYWLFLSLVRAARSDDFLGGLDQIGLRIRPDTSAAAFVAATTALARSRLRESGWLAITDELALQSFQVAVGESVLQSATTLFGADVESVQAALRTMSTKDSVAKVARRFFSEFMYRVLARAFERQISDSLATGGRFRSSDDLSEFHARLRAYCWDVSKLVEEYSGGWYSKHTWLGDIGEKQTGRFTGYAIDKLFSELSSGAQ
jgi:hypothetical protein